MSNQIINENVQYFCMWLMCGWRKVENLVKKISELCSNSDGASYIHFHTNMNIKNDSMNPHPKVTV